MPGQELKSIDDYEVFLTERMTSWTSQQRVALAAGIAERWLPTYESFSSAEEWGDPGSLLRSLEAVWQHVQGHTLTESDLARHLQQIDEITPHMDDFDAEEALIACVILKDALRSCGDSELAIRHVVSAATGVFEGLIEEWPVEPVAQRRAWSKKVVRNELKAQLRLIEEVNAVATFNGTAVKELRGHIDSLKVKPGVRSRPKAPPGLTNQAMFEQYRRYVESDLKGQVKEPEETVSGSFLFAVTYLGYWMGRYSRRLQSINGSYGRLADEVGQRAIVSRNLALDKTTGPLEWDQEVLQAVEMCLQNNSQLKFLDAGSIETAHGYGPSLRRLWLQGRRQGNSEQDGWKHVRIWASHRPAVWEAEDSRKKKGLAHSSPELGEKLAESLLWTSSNDPIYPWATKVEGDLWRVRVNDFPDEVMYSLIIGSENAGDFHDWPETWRRSNTP